MFIREALNLKKSAFISLVGAGGKSTLFSLLAREIIEEKKKLILTTTTHMLTRQLIPFIEKGVLIESDNEEITDNLINKWFKKAKHRELILVHHRLKSELGEKIAGPSPLFLSKCWKSGLVDYFLVESDGARGRSIKAPGSHEPVICKSTTDVIGVIGIDALGSTLNEKSVFRPHLFSELTGMKMEEKISIDAITALICHPMGLFKNAPLYSKCHLFINKVDNDSRKKMAKKLAVQVLKYNSKKIDDITIGSGCNEIKPVIEAIKRSQ